MRWGGVGGLFVAVAVAIICSCGVKLARMCIKPCKEMCVCIYAYSGRRMHATSRWRLTVAAGGRNCHRSSVGCLPSVRVSCAVRACSTGIGPAEYTVRYVRSRHMQRQHQQKPSHHHVGFVKRQLAKTKPGFCGWDFRQVAWATYNCVAISGKVARTWELAPKAAWGAKVLPLHR